MGPLRNKSINVGRVIFLVVLVCVFSRAGFGDPWPGSGDANDPYQIHSARQMQAIGADSNYWDAHFKLMVDIDLGGYTGAEYNIIGNWDTPFRGVFDGNGHRIYNFTYDSNVVNYIGLFWYVDDPNSEIKNLGLIDPNIDGAGGTVSSLVVRLENGTVTDCYVEGGRISGLGSASGLVGSLGGPGGTATVSNCHASVNVSGGGSNGGLVGENYYGSISNCYSTGSVSGDMWVGGLVGENIYGGEISDCYSTCAVSGVWSVGGLVGVNDDSAHISNSSATGNVTGTDRFVGGLVGANHSDSTISGCYAGGDVSGKYYVGGLVGVNTSDILNSYANGSILGGYDVGGLVGENWNGTISNCYSAGSVSGISQVGGLVGYDDSGSYTRCFWDNTVNPSLTGIGNGSNPEVIGESTTNMQMAVTFAGWGCEPVWTIDEGNDYPRLWWENAPGEVLSNQWYAGGSGEPNDPYLIETAEQLNNIGRIPCDWDNHFQLTVDIDLASYTGTSFNIIGRYVGIDDPNNKPFTGVFDGDGHTISNFSYSSDGNDFIAIFAYIDDVNAEIKNLGLIDPNIDAGTGWGIGALVGWLKYGTVRNCYVEGGSVSGGWGVGGLVGYHDTWSLITECYASSNVSGTGWVGGLVGGNNATIAVCYSSGEVSGNISVGGLVGWDDGWGDYIKSFWDSTVNPDVNGIGNGADPDVIGETTANMQTESTFTSAGWDFTTPIWTICEGEDYPRLAWEKYGGGNGTEANPYLIRTSCQMNAIGADSNDWDKHFKLMADIDLGGYTGTSFNIIGTSWDNVFAGVFDGNGHTISKFTYDSNGVDYIGLFGYVNGPNAEIKNLSVTDPNINAGTGSRVGSLVGEIEQGTITSCYVKGGTVSGYSSVGGLVGSNFYGEISDCYAQAEVFGVDFEVGGLVGNQLSDGTISNCYATGTVLATRGTGGLVGTNDGMVSNCYASGDVSGNEMVGGLAGYDSKGSISNCYATGDVSGNGEVGGLVGQDAKGKISNCYATGTVDGNDYVGGLLGSGNGYYTKCFWDSDVNPDVNGIGNTTDPNVIGETTANMQTESTFTDAGWDFVGELVNGPNDVWTICEGEDYPKLTWQFIIGDFDGDDDIDFADFAVFAAYWLEADSSFYCGGGGTDLTNDGQVGLDDLRQFTESWLAGM